ncbi:unnamed protein product [Lathyrus sativus]|nr:unnamed protein product [Lathyrus sativus]
MADWTVLKNKTTGEREDQDFDEQDVWGDYTSNIKRVSKDHKDFSSGSSSGSGSSAWTLPRKNIPKGNNAVSDDPFAKGSSSSAPMKIPDWSKVYGKKNCKNGDDEDEDDEEGDMVPPHEWIARKLARSQISSFSVCEGMGRTLKGRDLSKVRNAILTKTGFIE